MEIKQTIPRRAANPGRKVKNVMKRTNLEQVHIDQMADSDAAQWTAAKASAELAEKEDEKFVIVYNSSRAPGGVKLVGNPEDCTLEYPDTVLVFDAVEEAKAYIDQHEPLLDSSNIKPACDWL